MTYRYLVIVTRRLRALAATAAVVALAWCTLGTSAQASDKIVSADGQQQWISCAGSGSPTMVISSGLDADHTMWAKVMPGLAAITRTCIYDRPGLGPSPPRQGSLVTDAGQQAQELHALLQAVGVHHKVVIIAHSYAGLIARAYAVQYRHGLAGMMLMDAVFPGIQRNYLPNYAGPWHEGGTTIDMDASSAATDGGPNLGHLPLVVLTAGSTGDGQTAQPIWDGYQRAAARLSTNSLHLYAPGSGHVIQQDKPERVIQAARLLIESIRTHTPLRQLS